MSLLLGGKSVVDNWRVPAHRAVNAIVEATLAPETQALDNLIQAMSHLAEAIKSAMGQVQREETATKARREHKGSVITNFENDLCNESDCWCREKSAV